MTGELPDTDLRRVHALAVHTDDVLDALEAREQTGRDVVLRALPPFSGRMRARLHVVVPTDDEPGAAHFHPGVFVASPPPFPRVDDTADELREAGEYDVETHRDRHESAVDEWREAVQSRLRDQVELTSSAWQAAATLEVRYLG